MPVAPLSIRQQAEETARNAGVWGIIPVPLERIAADLGYSSVNFTPNERTFDIAGAVNYDERTIYLNERDLPERQRFTLAHEIGHAVLHGGESVVDYRCTLHSSDDPKERQANQFAAELIMPDDQFRQVWQSRGGVKKRVAAYFGVSQEAVSYRAANLRLRP